MIRLPRPSVMQGSGDLLWLSVDHTLIHCVGLLNKKTPQDTQSQRVHLNPGHSRPSGFYVLCINCLWLFKCWKSMNSSPASAPRGFLISLPLLWPQQVILKRCVCNWQQELWGHKEITRVWIWSLIQHSGKCREECPSAWTFLCLWEYIL